MRACWRVVVDDLPGGRYSLANREPDPDGEWLCQMFKTPEERIAALPAWARSNGYDDVVVEIITERLREQQARESLARKESSMKPADGDAVALARWMYDNACKEREALREQVATLTAERDEARLQADANRYVLDNYRDECRRLRVENERLRPLRVEVERLRSEVRRLSEEGLRRHQPEPWDDDTPLDLSDAACESCRVPYPCEDRQTLTALAALCDPVAQDGPCRRCDGAGCTACSAQTCPHGDPTCPCPDGLVCHYQDTSDTPAMAPVEAQEEGE